MIFFEWYSNKAKLIAEKHGLKMEVIKKIFDDPLRIEQFDTDHSGQEDRRQVLGKVNRVLFAVYTERDDRIRIITARKATGREKSIYYGKSNEGEWSIS